MVPKTLLFDRRVVRTDSFTGEGQEVMIITCLQAAYKTLEDSDADLGLPNCGLCDQGQRSVCTNLHFASAALPVH